MISGGSLWPLQRPRLAQGLRLVTTMQEYVLVDDQQNAIYLHRSQTHECVISTTSSTGGETTPRGSDGVPISGVLGVVELFSGPYLLAVTAASLVGSLAGHDVYKIGPAGVQCFPFAPSLDALPPERAKEERSFLNLLGRFFRCGAFDSDSGHCGPATAVLLTAAPCLRRWTTQGELAVLLIQPGPLVLSPAPGRLVDGRVHASDLEDLQPPVRLERDDGPAVFADR